ncbi:MAG: hypothetical protein LBV70_03850 [Candidatus Adiutrix sp.]|nr:hypothetical protein [Candidatus Adiutrix sp.]
MFRFLVAIGLLLALQGAMGGTPASARVEVFEDTYSLDLPKDWDAVQVEPGFLMLVSPDQTAVFLITVGQSMPKHREKTAPFVKKYAHLRQGGPTDRMSTLMRIKPKRVAVTIIGDHPDRVKLYWSIKALPGNKMMEEWGGG